MNRRSKQSIVAIAILILGFTFVFALSNFLEAKRISLPESYEDQDLSLQGRQLKGYALGAEGLVADWYWMWSLQYLGGKLIRSEAESINVDNLTALNPRLLYPLLNNATDLDPKFGAAYSFGAIVLPAINPEQAIALTEKGIANNPEQWRLYQYLGYIHWRLEDYEKAAEVYQNGSAVAGSPAFMRMMAASMKTAGGSRDVARRMYLQMRDESEDQQSRANAELRLMELDSLDERDAINNVLSELKERIGRCPSRLGDVIPMLGGVKLPEGKNFRVDVTENLVDPTDVPYRLDTETCTAKLGTESRIPGPLR